MYEMLIKDILKFLRDKQIDYIFYGEENSEIMGFSSLNHYKNQSLTWIKKQEYYEAAGRPQNVQCAIVEKGLSVSFRNVIFAENSKRVFFMILKEFWGSHDDKVHIGEGTIVSEGVQIDPTASVGYNCSIIGNVIIGAETIIDNNVTIIGCVNIGDKTHIQSGAVIGSDGFGFSFDENGLPVKVEHFGGVTIGNDVHIGANACIDRGTIDDTIICDHVKIDNLVHVAHNTYIGEGALVIAGSVICGSATIEKLGYIAPGGIVRNQITIHEGGFLGLGAVATEDVAKDTVVMGVPAVAVRNVERSDK